ILAAEAEDWPPFSAAGSECMHAAGAERSTWISRREIPEPQHDLGDRAAGDTGAPARTWPQTEKNSLVLTWHAVGMLCPILPQERNILPFEYPFSFIYGKSFLVSGAADALLAGLSRSRQRNGGPGRLRPCRAQQAAALAGGRRQCPLVFFERRCGRGGAAG